MQGGTDLRREHADLSYVYLLPLHQRFPFSLVAGTGAYEWALLHAPDANPRPQSNRPKHTQHGSPHENSPAAASSAINSTSGMIVEPVQMTSKKESAEFELITDKNRQKWQRYHQAIEQEQFKMTQPNSAQEKYSTTQPEDELSSTLAADVSKQSLHLYGATILFPLPTFRSCFPIEFLFVSQQLSTVGAVVVSMSGDVYAGVSSGGIWMKQPGRIGHVSQRGLSSANEISRSTTLTACKILLCHFVQGAIFGSGCSAANGIACSISGTGEDIIECLLAHQITSYTANKDQMPSTSTTIRPSSPREASTKHSGIKRKEHTVIDGISNGAAAHSAKRHKQCLTESTLLAQSPIPSLSDRLRSCLDTGSLHSGLDAGIIAVEVKRNHHSRSVSSSAPIPLSVDLAWSHSTRHFGIGFMQNGGVPYAEISSLQDETTDLVKGLMPFNTNTEPTSAFSSTRRICTAGRKFQLN